SDDLERLKPMQFYVKNDVGQLPFKLQVPILSKNHYLRDSEKKDFLQDLIYNSKQYTIVPSISPIIPTAQNTTTESHIIPKTIKEKKKPEAKKDNPFDDDLRPAF
ncbi:MAG: hypothetical protein K2X39_00125, partial [Silvanigrellaceae bacterium]|nr:hypothetical protein [Silvanigrellaceae bacterium]